MFFSCFDKTQSKFHDLRSVAKKYDQETFPLDILVVILEFLCYTERRYDGGNLIWQNNYVNGELHGDSIGWWNSGNMKYHHRYVYGKKNGLSRTWYPFGSLKSKYFYLDGRKHGRCQVMYDTGLFSDRKEIEREDMYVHGVRHGKCLEWQRNGNLKSERYYKNGRLHGDVKIWWNTKNRYHLQRHETYVNGMLQGKRCEWYRSGRVKSIRKYNNGIRVG